MEAVSFYSYLVLSRFIIVIISTMQILILLSVMIIAVAIKIKVILEIITNDKANDRNNVIMICRL